MITKEENEENDKSDNENKEKSREESDELTPEQIREEMIKEGFECCPCLDTYDNSFEELLDKHIEWLSGQLKACGYMGNRSLDDIEGDNDFIKFLKDVSIGLQMVTIKSQPPILDNLNLKCYLHKSLHTSALSTASEEELGNFIVHRRPYIKGAVTIQTFWNIFKVDQKDLMIAGRLPFMQPNAKMNKDKLATYNIIPPRKKSDLGYRKNICEREIGITLRKYKKSKDNPKFHTDKGLAMNKYSKELMSYDNFEDRLAKKETTLMDRELCEIYIIHPEFNVDQKIFEECVRGLINKISNELTNSLGI